MSTCPSSRTIEESSDTDVSPFRLLRVTPRTRKDEITAAYAQALRKQAAPEQGLSLALNRLLDPEQRLICELTYPLDATPEQVETFYSLLSDTASMSDSLAVAAGFPPLSRATFITNAATRTSVSGDLLIALISAHADVDPVAIYTLLKSVRQSADLPAPSLLAVREGLLELTTQRFSAVLAAHDLQSTAIALSDCARRILAENDPLCAELLSHLLDIYRSLSSAQRNQASCDLKEACQHLGQRAQGDLDAAEIMRFERSLGLLASLSAPLELQSGSQDAMISEALANIKDLLAGWNESRKYQDAKLVLDEAIRALAPISLAAAELINVRDVLERLLVRDALATLQAQIDRIQDDPRMALKELRRLTVDRASSQPAGSLASAFRLAVEQTRSTAFEEHPWILIHQLAVRCSIGSPKAMVSLLPRLVEFGESMSAPTSTLDHLRADLAGLSPHPSVQVDVAKSRALRARRVVAWMVALPLLAGVPLLISYEMGLMPIIHQGLATQDPAIESRASELLPPVGTGQRLTREYVRYCKFQEQRLAIVKQHLHAADDVRAYNALVSDYNSRCSDFYYQDEDINAVMSEISANSKMLEADAHKIISTWPWRATSNTAQPPPR